MIKNEIIMIKMTHKWYNNVIYDKRMKVMTIIIITINNNNNNNNKDTRYDMIYHQNKITMIKKYFQMIS